MSVMMMLWVSSVQSQEINIPLKITLDELQIESKRETTTRIDGYMVEIGGPDGYYETKEIPGEGTVRFDTRDYNGVDLADGLYTMQITPIVKLTEAERNEILRLSATGMEEQLAKYRNEVGLPEEVDVLSYNYSIRDGQFVIPRQEIPNYYSNIPKISSEWHYNSPGLYASLDFRPQSFPDPFEGTGSLLTSDLSAISQFDQVIPDDLIVQGSICIGLDCVNNESFGFSTIKLKENNTRIRFEDTSVGTFPNVVWDIVANDSQSGGANYLAFADITNAKTPFLVSANSPNNSVYISSTGRVGFRTAAPILDLHVSTGNTPGLRLEQSGSSGFAAQTWDIAGNEANFFIRDVTSGSRLPFRIRPGAPTSSLDISASGNVGLGLGAPTQRLDIATGNVTIREGNLGINTMNPTVALDVIGNMKLDGSSLFEGDVTVFLASGAAFFGTNLETVLKIDGVNSRVGIGVNAPNHQLELSTDDAFKPSGGSWMGASDRRLKKDINPFSDGLEVLMQIKPVKFRYNGLLNLPDNEEHIGVIAQEIAQVAPYTVKPLANDDPEIQQEKYLGYDASALTYVLINSVQEQQKIIDQQNLRIATLEKQLEATAALEEKVAQLTAFMNDFKEKENSTTNNRGEKNSKVLK